MQAIAHRGASGYAPENTRAAFDRAIALRAAAIETDVQLTADGYLILLHDGTVDRTSNGSGPVADYTLDELRALDFGGWYAPEFAGQRVLTVAEFLDDYAARIDLCLEIKDPRATAPLVALLTERKLLDRVQVTSFYWTALMDARALNPDLYLGFLTPTFEDDIVERSIRRGFRRSARTSIASPRAASPTPTSAASTCAPGASLAVTRPNASSRPARTARPVTGRIGSPSWKQTSPYDPGSPGLLVIWVRSVP